MPATSQPDVSSFRDTPALVDAGGLARVRVKICGLTSARDAEAAIHAGADALGFNAWKGSKRFLDIDAAGVWMRDLPCFVTKVALCVNHSLEEALRLAGLPWIDVVQFHGDESAEFCARFAERAGTFIRAVRPASAHELDGLGHLGTRQVLLDASVAGAYGGTGARVDLELAAKARARHPELSLILAGGLTPNNVGEAVRVVRPYAVDVASGVESAPGRKDAALMRAFVAAARER